MPVADLAIIAAIAYQAWTGMRVGLVMGIFQLVVLIGSIVAALILEEPVAARLEGIVPADPGMRRLATFFVITTGASVVFNFIGGKILGPIMARQQRSKASSRLDKALGLIPAAVRGVMYAGSLVYMARLVMPLGDDIRTQLDASALANFVLAVFEALTPYARAL